MENASKALIMAASILIGIMLLSFLVFIFNRFGDTARATDKRLSQREIDSFNSKFSHYETGGEHQVTDEIGVTLVPEYGGSSDIKYFQYNKLFKESPGISENYYNKALISVSQTLNKVADVVSAINDAIDVNDRNNDGYLYNGLEIQNSVEIIVDLGTEYNKFNFNKIDGTPYRYLVIEPNKSVRAKNVYGFNSLKDTKEKRVDDFKVEDKNTIKVYNMLEELRDTKVIDDKNKQYTIYKYYFFGEVIKNDFTELIDSVKFTLVEDKNFNNN